MLVQNTMAILEVRVKYGKQKTILLRFWRKRIQNRWGYLGRHTDLYTV